MKRREFIALLGGTAVAWPLTARAQQPVKPVIGYFSARSPESDVPMLAAFRRGLNETGYIEGKNVAIEFRWAYGQYDRLPALAAELVHRQVAVIVTAGGENTALAAKAATATIPIVFVAGGDPVQFGLVASLSRPGANVTGLTALLGDLGAKKLALLRDLVPRAATIGFLMNPSFTHAESQLRDMQEAVRALALQIHVLRASTDSEIDSAFESIAQQRIPALAVGSDPFFVTRREQLIAQAARHAVPTMYSRREFAEAGGLMSYGSSTVEVYRQIGLYTGQILNGANPADLPVMQPTKFEFVINLKTAKALGLEFPPGLLAIADEVID